MEVLYRLDEAAQPATVVTTLRVLALLAVEN
jgi:hypothetical protein